MTLISSREFHRAKPKLLKRIYITFILYPIIHNSYLNMKLNKINDNKTAGKKNHRKKSVPPRKKKMYLLHLSIKVPYICESKES